ncbi:VOC family protein [Anaerolineae bacterium CFX9]|jgi:extradiol dioxygenase family protein|nr:hypothetical protein [Geitlerinema splendidum]MDK3160609.1 hypothetical protein [Kamptonema cortianum]MDL1900421.1 VOC family protein [Anaerolineae bacterium CFX9]
MLTQATVYPTVPAHDIGRAREFYEQKLGLSPLRELAEGVLYQLSGGTLLYLYPSQWAGTAGHTVASFMVSDIHAVVSHLRARGVRFENYDLPGLRTVDGIAELDGEYAAWFKDTEGNILAIGQFTS